MRIIFIEFHWQVKEVLKNREKFKNDIIISLHHETSYLLMSNKIRYFETFEFCKHDELWKKYNDITKNSLNIVKVLDDTLWEIDDRFRKLKWDLFNNYYYAFKISYDQLYYYSELIYQTINKYNPSEIWVADSPEVNINSSCLIPLEASILKFLLGSVEEKNKRIKINYMIDINPKNIQNIHTRLSNIIKRKLKNFVLKINFLFSYYFSQPSYISVGCDEVSIFKKLYPKDSSKFLSYKYENLNDSKLKKNWIFFEKFLNRLKNVTNFEELITHRGISSKLIFHQIVSKITKRLDFFIYEYENSKKMVKNLKPLSVIFQTMTPFYSPNIVFRKICKDLKIPFATWTHGGSGLRNSFLHYDATDYRLSSNIISWGVHLKELLKDNKATLNQLDLQTDIKIFPVGSVRLDNNYKKYFLKKNTLKKEKPILMFAAGSYQTKNQFYFGYNRKRAESLWLTDYNILKLLKKYQERYQIIFKDYPNNISSPNLWKKVLKDMNANNILYISNQKNLYTLLNSSDLVILPYMNSTFFDALYFDADIFVVEGDIFEKPFKQQFKDEIFYFKDEDKFKLNLEKYLEEGKFYQCRKKKSRNYFLNFDELNNRDKLLNEALNSISKPTDKTNNLLL